MRFISSMIASIYSKCSEFISLLVLFGDNFSVIHSFAQSLITSFFALIEFGRCICWITFFCISVKKKYLSCVIFAKLYVILQRKKEQTHDATQKIRCPQGTRHIVQRHGVHYGNSVSLCFIGRLSPCQVSKGYTCRKK